MADLSYPDALDNLKKYDKAVSLMVLQLYNQVNDTLKALIVDNDIGLRDAQNKLLREYNKALASTNFIEGFKVATVKVIANSSYTKAGLSNASKQEYVDWLWNTSQFPDNIKLSTRIRKNSALIVRDQKRVLRKALKGGKTVAQIVGNIGDDTLKGFTRELPQYIKDIKKETITSGFTKAGKPLKVPAQKVSAKQIKAVKAQAKRIKTGGLRADYLKLIEAIELDKNVDKAVYFAMERKTKYYAERVARTETIQSMATVRNHIAMQDPDTQLVKNITQGSNPCPFCIATENLGYVPVENATIPTHHPHCSCRPRYKKTIKRPKKWSDETFINRQQTEINKVNAERKAQGLPITYIEPIKPVNLRETDLLKNFPVKK